jgi:hypothetical protein
MYLNRQLFARVDVVAAQRQEKAEPIADVSGAAAATPLAVPTIALPRTEGLIEIVLPNGAALRRVLGVLHER